MVARRLLVPQAPQSSIGARSSDTSAANLHPVGGTAIAARIPEPRLHRGGLIRMTRATSQLDIFQRMQRL